MVPYCYHCHHHQGAMTLTVQMWKIFDMNIAILTLKYFRRLANKSLIHLIQVYGVMTHLIKRFRHS